MTRFTPGSTFTFCYWFPVAAAGELGVRMSH